MMIAGLLAATLLGATPTGPVQTIADTVPRFDIARSCRNAGSLDMGVGRTNQACRDDESKARADLDGRWMQFSAVDRNQCRQTAELGETPSYVQLLTCLEMATAPK